VRVQALIFRGDEAGLQIAKRLKELKKANPKLDIRVIVDGVSNPEWQTQWMYITISNKTGSKSKATRPSTCSGFPRPFQGGGQVQHVPVPQASAAALTLDSGLRVTPRFP
jgi:hypothetical protein